MVCRQILPTLASCPRAGPARGAGAGRTPHGSFLPAHCSILCGTEASGFPRGILCFVAREATMPWCLLCLPLYLGAISRTDRRCRVLGGGGQVSPGFLSHRRRFMIQVVLPEFGWKTLSNVLPSEDIVELFLFSQDNISRFGSRKFQFTVCSVPRLH